VKRILSNRWFRAGVYILLGGIFLFAGSTSIRSPANFADSVAGYQLLSAPVINLVALTLPPFELLIGILLLLGWFRRAVTLAALMLSILFAVALASALARGLTIDCGCFGHGPPSRLGMWMALGRDVLMGGVLGLLYASEFRSRNRSGDAAGVDTKKARFPTSKGEQACSRGPY
jgi:uncharacterized membrane protein YphA (DoxX/SURF4 family)